jgi:dihydropteroate synthase
MHMQGTPKTMQEAPHYDDVVSEVRDFLVSRAAKAVDAGVREVWIDPGIGFGKTVEHNLSLLRHLRSLVATGLPVAVGVSRKWFLGQLTDGAPVEDRLEASVAAAAWCAAEGAALLRVHDVRATVHAVRVVEAVR